MTRFPTALTQHGPPRPAWQTFHFWWTIFTEALTGIVMLGGAVGYVVLAAWAAKWLGF